jgi:hypothetical protein
VRLDFTGDRAVRGRGLDEGRAQGRSIEVRRNQKIDVTRGGSRGRRRSVAPGADETRMMDDDGAVCAMMAGAAVDGDNGATSRGAKLTGDPSRLTARLDVPGREEGDWRLRRALRSMVVLDADGIERDAGRWTLESATR